MRDAVGSLAVPLALVAVALGLAACGTEVAPTAPRGWSVARVEGLAGASGVAWLGDELVLVAGGGDRRIHVVSRSDLVHGASLRPRTFPFDVEVASRVSGSAASPEESLAARGYTVGDLWGLPVEIADVAAGAPDVLFVAERTHRVVYWGSVRRGADGRVAGARLERAFVVPGGERPGRVRADWRDVSPGLAGIAAVARQGPAENVYVAESPPPGESRFRVWTMDRFGQATLWFAVAGAGVVAGAPVVGLAWDGERFLSLSEGPDGPLLAFVEGRPRGTSTAVAEGSLRVPGVLRWTGLAARRSDGRTDTVLLGATADGAVLAWPEP